MSASDRSPDDLVEAAEAALAEGHPLAALELCQRLLAKDPGDPNAWFLEAEALRELREAPDAELSYRRAIELDAENASAWCGLASVLFDQRRFEEAASGFRRALRLEPVLADAWFGRALVREIQGDFAGAQRAYLHAHHRSAAHPVPRALSDPEHRALLVQAAGDDAPEVAAWLSRAPLVFLDLPHPEICEAYDPPASPAEVLAHLAAGADTAHPSSTLPPAILVFRRNVERYASDRPQVLAALRAGVIEQVQAWMSRATQPDA
jgi:tetratricopeptide (TPR) repeat protein